MLNRLVLAGLLASVAVATTSLAEPASQPSGAWILDVTATEDSVMHAPPPLKAEKVAEWFQWQLIMSALLYEFDGESAYVGSYGDTRKLEYRVLQRQGAVTTYAQLNAPGSTTDTLTVHALNNGSMQIVQSTSPEMTYLLWKPITTDPKRLTPKDAIPAMTAWTASVQNIVKFLDAPSNKPATTSGVRK